MTVTHTILNILQYLSNCAGSTDGVRGDNHLKGFILYLSVTYIPQHHTEAFWSITQTSAQIYLDI